MAFFVEPLQYQFFVHGLVAALLVGCAGSWGYTSYCAR